MTQNERWQRQYEEMMTLYPQDRLEKFAILLKVADKYRRKNQYEYR